MREPRNIDRTSSAYKYPLLVKQLLHTPIHYAPDQEIVYSDEARYTYRDLYDRIHRLASALSSLGVGPGDSVAVLDWDSHRYLECFFAIPMMGATLHTVNIRFSPEQILSTMNQAKDLVVLTHVDFLPMLEKIADELHTVKSYVLLKEGQKTPFSSLQISGEYEDLLSQGENSFTFPEYHEDTIATLFHTTGTTGNPKGVYFSHRQLVLHTLTGAMYLGCYTDQGQLQSTDVYMPLTPMFHVHAWGIPYMATLLGVKQVYPGRYDPEHILKLIESEKVTFSHCVPTILHMLVHHPLADQIDLSNWKVQIGGSAFPKGLAETVLERGVDAFGAYGQSETCPFVSLAKLKPHMLEWDMKEQLNVRTKAGFPVPLVNLKIVDESGNSLPWDGKSSGEVVVRAPWLTQGYFKDTQRSEELWKDGWLHTGDIGTIDKEGYLQITDRMKDRIKSGGEWISSIKLENLISQHDAVLEVAVVGVPHEKWGERPVAMVVFKAGDSEKVPSEDDLRTFLQKYVKLGEIAKWSIPDTIHIVNELPKTSVGKIDKKEIRNRLTSDVD